MAEDNEKKNLEETKLTNEKLGQLKSSIDESAEDAEFARQEAAANAADEIGGSEESQQEDKASTKANIDAESKQTKVLEEIEKNGRKASKDSQGAGKLFGGALGAAGKGLGGAISGVGLGIGAAGAGIGVALLGAATFAEKIANLDGKKIKDNIVEIMSIPDSVGGGLEMLKDGGALTLALTGLGIGLAAFAIGSGAAAGVAMFTDGSNFAATIKGQVVELLSIKDELGGNTKMLADGGAFYLAMMGIGLGLAVFGAGSAIAGMSDGLKTFTGTGNFAENIKEQVVTLLSISDELGGAGNLIGQGAAFLLAMTGIGLGLAVFGAGSAVGGLGTALADFSTGGFAQGIKDSVVTLLSISDELGGAGNLIGDGAEFLLAMTGIGLGLAVFGIGANVAGLTTALADFTTGGFAQSIVDNVTTLLGISESLGGAKAFIGDSATFLLAMTGIGAGLLAFGAGSGIGAFIDGVGKLFGGESPMEKILRLADNVESIKEIKPALTDAGAGLEKFANATEKLGSKTSKAGIKNFLGMLADLDNKGRIKNLEKFVDAISLVPEGFTMSFGGRSGRVNIQNMGSRQGASMAATQDDSLNRQANNASQPVIVQNAGGNQNQSMAVTTVNNTITPDRDLTMSMYGMGPRQLI
tara:strand:- start:5531 stop:7450 length:1920 start_codon:yes stop_codon:yes gene_type:complete